MTDSAGRYIEVSDRWDALKAPIRCLAIDRAGLLQPSSAEAGGCLTHGRFNQDAVPAFPEGLLGSGTISERSRGLYTLHLADTAPRAILHLGGGA